MKSKCIYFYDKDIGELNDHLKKGWVCKNFISTPLNGSFDNFCINYVILEKND